MDLLKIIRWENRWQKFFDRDNCFTLEKIIPLSLEKEEYIAEMQYSPEQNFLGILVPKSSSCKETLYVFNTKDFSSIPIKLSTVHQYQKSFEFNKNRQLLACDVEDKKLFFKLWDSDTGRCLQVIPLELSPVKDFCFLSEKEVLFCQETKNFLIVKKINLQTEETTSLAKFLENSEIEERIHCVALHPGGNYIAISTSTYQNNSIEYFLKFWEIKTQKLVSTIIMNYRTCAEMVFTPCGTKLIYPPACSCCPLKSEIYDVSEIENPCLFDVVRSLDYTFPRLSAKGEYLLISDRNERKKARIWSFENQKEIDSVPTCGLWHSAMAPDKRQIACIDAIFPWMKRNDYLKNLGI